MNIIYKTTKGQMRLIILLGIVLALYGVDLTKRDNNCFGCTSYDDIGFLILICSLFLTVFYYLGWKNFNKIK